MHTHPTELSWIQSLHETLRNPSLDTFFLYWNFVDTIWFVTLFLAAIIYLFNRKEGISLLFLFLLSNIINLLLKNTFQMPRPSHIDPSLGLVDLTSYGFPSGAAQTATIIAGVALVKCKSNIWKILGVIFALFLCFSRIYLGVHFFTDILGGIFVGSCLLLIYLKFFPRLENHWGKIASLISLPLFFLDNPKFHALGAMILGYGVGLFLSKKATLFPTITMRTITFLIVSSGTFAILYFGKKNPTFAPTASFLAAIWFIHFGNYLVEKSCSLRGSH